MTAPTQVNGAGYWKPFTISNAHRDATLAGFPVMIRITNDTDIGAHCRSDMRDFWWTLADGTLLTHKARSRSNPSGSATAFYLASHPSMLSSQNEVIYAQYGKASASTDLSANPHDSYTKGCWALDETGTVTTWASETGANDGTNSSATAGTGNIDGCATFASPQYIDCGTNGTVNTTTLTTMAGWFKSTATSGVFWCKGGTANVSPPSGFYAFCDGTGKLQMEFASSGAACIYHYSTATTINDGNWHHIAFTHNGTTIKIYVDANDVTPTPSQTGTFTGNIGNASYPVRMSGYYDGFNFVGSLDEVSVSATDRSAAWIKFLKYNASGGDVTAGAESAFPSAGFPFPLLYQNVHGSPFARNRR